MRVIAQNKITKDVATMLRNTFQKITIPVVATIFVLATLLYSYSTVVDAAGPATITLSPSSGSYDVGDKIVVTANVNNSQALIGAQVDITFNSNLLTYNRFVPITTPFDTSLADSSSAGSVSVSRTTFGSGRSGTSGVARFEFTAKARGSAVVSVASTSEVWLGSDGTNVWNDAQATATLTIKTPSTTSDDDDDEPSDNTTETPKTNNNNTSTDTPNKKSDSGSGDSTSPDSSNTGDGSPSNPSAGENLEESPEVVERYFKKAIIQLKSKVPVKAEIFYGVDGQLVFATGKSKKFSKTPKIELDPALIEPGRTYSYKVTLTDEDGNVTETEVKTFRATGYKLKLVFRNRDGSPVKRLKVQLRSEPREGTTDDEGEVIFEDVELGQHTAYFNIDGSDMEQTVTVDDNASVGEDGNDIIPIQVAAINVSTSSSRLLLIAAVGSLSVLAMFGGFLLVFKKKLFGNKQAEYVDNNSAFSKPEENDQFEPEQEAYLKPTPPDATTVITPDSNSGTIDSDKK